MSLKNRLGFEKEPLYVMDGNAFLFRGFYANSAMSRSDGFPTGALYIVGKILLKLFKEENPSYFAFVLDGHGKHFRHEIYPAYKANRPPAPEALIQQVEPLKKMVQSLGMKVIVSENCEADDCIASLARTYEQERPVIIIGVDKDLRQCLTPNVFLWDPSAKEEKLITLKSFSDDTGLTPEQWPDVQALIGDATDNVPGVKGIGEKTAEKIFKDFKSLEDLCERKNELPAPIYKKMDGNFEAVFLYRELTRLHTDVCTLPLKELKISKLISSESRIFFKEYEMLSLLRELESLIRSKILLMEEKEKNTEPISSPAASQLSLLDTLSPQVLPPVPTYNNEKELPDFANCPVAVTPSPFIVRSMDNTFNVAFQKDNTVTEFSWKENVSPLIKSLQKASIIIVPDLKKLYHQNQEWKKLENIFDLSLAAYLLLPEDRDYSWSKLSAIHSEQSGISLDRPASLALSLYRFYTGTLRNNGLLPLLEQVEVPLIPVLFSMESEGITIDSVAFKLFLEEVQNELNRLTQKIYDAAGTTFNIRSAQQIGEILYKKLGLTSGKNTKGGQASTSQTVLEKLSGQHPVIDALLEFRKLEKIRSTYLEPLPRLMDSACRIHTTFNQTATATGRLSSSNPNLQNIPVRGELGRRMRTCFTASPNCLLISADYSQVELRILAHYSKDPTLITSFRNNEDIHARTAAILHDKEPSEVTPDERRKAKTINFGLIYGMGARKLAQDLNIPLSEAKGFMEKYFEHFSHIKNFFEAVETKARSDGYVTTLSGRRRPLPNIQSDNGQARALAERQSVNTLIQGSAADIIKSAMISVYNNEELKRLNARLLLQIHDELIIEVPKENAEKAASILSRLMSDTKNLGILMEVPLPVDVGIGSNWGDAH